MCAQPHEVAVEAGQFRANHAQILGAQRHVKLRQLLNREAVHKVVAHVIEVVHAVSHDQGALILLGFHVLLDTGVQIADIGNAVHNRLTIQFKHEAQHAVRTGMLRSHVEDHGLAGQRALADEILQRLKGCCPIVFF